MEQDSEQRRRLTLVVQAQLRRVLSNSPDELAEYIVVLLAHGKSEPEMADALAEFLQDQAPRFAAWLFAHLEKNRLCYDLPQGVVADGSKAPPRLAGRLSRAKRDWRSTQDSAADAGAHAGVGNFVGGGVGRAVSRRIRSALVLPEEGLAEEVPVGRDSSPGRAREDAPSSKRTRRSSPSDDLVGRGRDRGEVHRGDRRGGRATEPPSRLVTTALKSLLGVQHSDSRPRKKAPQSHVLKKREERNGARGRDVFKRLGPQGPSGQSFPPGIGPARTSVFDRLEGGGGKSPGMNMQVRMDNRTHQGGQSTTFMVTVNNSAQEPQGRQSFQPMPGESSSLKGVRATKAVKSVVERVRVDTEPPAPQKEPKNAPDDKMEELNRLREKLGKMEEDIANLRAQGQLAEKGAGAREEGRLSPVSTEQPQSPTSVMADIDRRCVVVQNVHFHATKEVLAAHFGQCGRIVDVTFVLTKFGFSKGYAFVEFQDTASVERALALSGSLLMHRVIKVIRKETRLPITGTARPSNGQTPSPFPPATGVPSVRGWINRRVGRASGKSQQSSRTRAAYRYVRGGSDSFPSGALSGQTGHALSATQEENVNSSDRTGTEHDSESCEPALSGTTDAAVSGATDLASSGTTAPAPSESSDLDIVCPPECENFGNSFESALVDEDMVEF